MDECRGHILSKISQTYTARLYLHVESKKVGIIEVRV
jgi:hypothetical protein